jgi:hypothetical protein
MELFRHPDFPENQAYIYFFSVVVNQHMKEEYVKIGHTVNPEQRLKTLQTGCPLEINIEALLLVYSQDLAQLAETSIHKKLKLNRVKGEWFRLDSRLHRFIKCELKYLGFNGVNYGEW